MSRRESLLLAAGLLPMLVGWMALFRSNLGVMAHDGWAQVHWPSYNGSNGIVMPALDD